ncbi:hypothetical protein [Desulfosporosinus sp. HMP52]|uniref:hypothetical protein n=1 Tax=Desulfosporosinus sp. HMP52 TaxID=1487923 RepID=UPI000FFF3FAE|nr:hypothetical protein [Desulfosporosinus sp. HMP52]
MNYEYSYGHTPALRNPCLFQQNMIRPTPTYYPTPKPTSATINRYNPYSNQYPRSNLYPRSQSPSPYFHYPNPYNSNLTGYPISSALPLFSSHSVPTYSYAPTVSSKGLVIVMIATLVLVALDLVIVRPQKHRSEAYQTNSNI